MDKPTYDFFETPPQSEFDLEEIVDNFIFSLEMGYFAMWEAIICQEENKELTPFQKKHLKQLIGFGVTENEPILYIDEQARPNKKWYEIANEIAERIVQGRRATCEVYGTLAYEGWQNLRNAIQKYGKKLSKPKGIKAPINVIPENIRHHLEIQEALDGLIGLGQMEELSLSNPEQSFRIEELINDLSEKISSVKYFKLSLEKIVTEFIELKEEDCILLEEAMIKKLGLKDRKADMTKKLKAFSC